MCAACSSLICAACVHWLCCVLCVCSSTLIVLRVFIDSDMWCMRIDAGVCCMSDICVLIDSGVWCVLIDACVCCVSDVCVLIDSDM